MESITKNRQSASMLLARVERAYGADQVPTDPGFAEELGHGWFNVAYRLRLRDGTQVVLKIAPPPHVDVMTYEQGMMRNELAAIALVESHTRVPVPHVDFGDLSRELIDADYFFMPFIEADNLGILLEHGELQASESAKYREQLGAMNSELNTIVGAHYGAIRGPGFTSWRPAFESMIENVLRDGERAGLDLGWPYSSVRAVIAENAAALDDVTEPRFVEWDLWPSNVMVRDGTIVSIIDHERAFFGDPLFEAGFAGLDLAAFGDPTAFIRGYGRAALAGSEPARRRLYTLYLVLIMIIETRYRGHQGTAQYDAARARLTELMAQFGHTV
ncbi:phosphotransferase family protein [Microbacterium sp. P5_E9]